METCAHSHHSMGYRQSDATLDAAEQCLHRPPRAEISNIEGLNQQLRPEEEDLRIVGAAAAPNVSLNRGFPANLARSSSYGNAYGCTTFDNDEENSSHEEKAQYPNKQFEVSFSGNADPLNPRSFSKIRKWTIVLIVSSGSTCVTCASSMYTLTYSQITEEFHVSRVVATLGLSLFVMGLGLGPMILGPLSEFYGRRPIYIISFAFFMIWLIPCAVAKNIETELISRFIDGFAGSAFLSVAGGTVGDMFERNVRTFRSLSCPPCLALKRHEQNILSGVRG